MSEVKSMKPRLLVVAGPNGAGKTTVTERGLAHEWFMGCEYIILIFCEGRIQGLEP